MKGTERQNRDLADDLDRPVRVASFAESRCLSLRHVLFEPTGGVALGMAPRPRRSAGRLGTVESRGSLTLILPAGEQRPCPGLPKLVLDKDRHFRPTLKRPAPTDPLAPIAN